MYTCIHNHLTCIHNYLACIHNHLACIHNYLVCIHNYLVCIHIYLASEYNYLGSIHNFLACLHDHLACIHKYFACIHHDLACIHDYFTCINVYLILYTWKIEMNLWYGYVIMCVTLRTCSGYGTVQFLTGHANRQSTPRATHATHIISALLSKQIEVLLLHWLLCLMLPTMHVIPLSPEICHVLIATCYVH